MNEENEDYEIVGYALSNEEERKKIQELKPDEVITDIYRGELGQKNAGGYEIIKEYSEKYLVPKFIVISYTPEFKNQNIVGEFNKYPFGACISLTEYFPNGNSEISSILFELSSIFSFVLFSAFLVPTPVK